MKTKQTLKNKTVLITRSANQVEDFINQLENLGAKPLTLPLIKNTPINQEELLIQLNRTNYDWIIFTSANAVRFFFETVSPKTISAKIAAVGEKTAALIKKKGLTIDFTPSQYTAKNLAEEIPIKTNDKILIPRSSLAKNNIVDILAARSCQVETISIYQNDPIEYSADELEEIFNQQIDFITFTSGSTVEAFIKTGVQLQHQKVICIGPETAKIAEKNSINITAIANPHTIEGMINSIINSN